MSSIHLYTRFSTLRVIGKQAAGMATPKCAPQFCFSNV